MGKRKTSETRYPAAHETLEDKRQLKAGRWSCEEHVVFLKCLNKFGKDWRAISKEIKTRTPVQVRTHAQKYFLKIQSGTYFKVKDLAAGESERLSACVRTAAAPREPLLPCECVATREHRSLGVPSRQQPSIEETGNSKAQAINSQVTKRQNYNASILEQVDRAFLNIILHVFPDCGEASSGDMATTRSQRSTESYGFPFKSFEWYPPP